MNIKLLQKQSGKTIRRVAEELDIPYSTYNNYLMGIREPNISVLIKLADYFDVSLDYLFGREYDNKIGYIPNNIKPIVKELIELNEVQIEKVGAYVKGMSDDNKN